MPRVDHLDTGGDVVVDPPEDDLGDEEEEDEDEGDDRDDHSAADIRTRRWSLSNRFGFMMERVAAENSAPDPAVAGRGMPTSAPVLRESPACQREGRMRGGLVARVPICWASGGTGAMAGRD